LKTLVLVALLAAACAPIDHVELDARWLPLRRIQTDASVPAGVYRTLGAVTTTHAAEDFVALPKEEQTALLLHEQLHAQHQAAQPSLLRDIAGSSALRWQEESAGWKLQLTYETQHGLEVDVEGVARFLANAYDSMISEEAAAAWVSSVVTSGRAPHCPGYDRGIGCPCPSKGCVGGPCSICCKPLNYCPFWPEKRSGPR